MTFPHYPKNREIYSHTGLRGIAALSVFIYHLSLRDKIFPGLPEDIFRFFYWPCYAVDLFFILSGFILNWVYLSQGNNINWISYIRARIARIIPLYFLTTLLFIPTDFYSIIKHGFLFVGKYYILVFISNILMLSGIIDGNNITFNGAAWSISVEFFCYVFVFTFLVHIAKKIYRFKINYCYMYLAVLLLTFMLYELYSLRDVLKHLNLFLCTWDATWLARGVIGFSLGFVLCNLFRKISVKTINLFIINGLSILCVVVFILTRISLIPDFLLLVSFPILVLITAFDQGFLCGILRFKPFQWLGERSYSIYLWHIPILSAFGILFKYSFIRSFHLSNQSTMLNFIIVVGSVLIVSELSYRFFEKPCRDYIRMNWLQENDKFKNI
jgi:peptidoglycan/LPS O-acetylase OafA/YrhL